MRSSYPICHKWQCQSLSACYLRWVTHSIITNVWKSTRSCTRNGSEDCRVTFYTFDISILLKFRIQANIRHLKMLRPARGPGPINRHHTETQFVYIMIPAARRDKETKNFSVLRQKYHFWPNKLMLNCWTVDNCRKWILLWPFKTNKSSTNSKQIRDFMFMFILFSCWIHSVTLCMTISGHVPV